MSDEVTPPRESDIREGETMFDIETLLKPISAEAPAGPNLEHDAEYKELEHAATEKPERLVGQIAIPAEEPNWRDVAERSSALFGRTKDLRVAMYLTRASLRLEGFAGLAQALELIRACTERFWPSLHPALETGDSDGAPALARINILSELTHRDTLNAVRTWPIARTATNEPITFREIEAAPGTGSRSTGGTAVDAAIHVAATGELESAAGAVRRCDEAAKALDEAWQAKTDEGPDLLPLRRVLARANQFLTERLRASLGADPGALRDASTLGTASASVGEPLSRGDVVRAIDLICSYYARNEPSSPVPILLERGKKLVYMSFLEVVKEILPEGLSSAYGIAGKSKP